MSAEPIAADVPPLPEGVHLLVGHCLETLGSLRAGSVHCCVVSPPYWNLRDYETEPVDWPELRYAPIAGLPEIVIPAMRCSLGREATLEAYVGHLVLLFRAVRVALRCDGTLWLNLGDSHVDDRKWGGATGGKHRRALHGRTGVSRARMQTGLPPKNLAGVPWRVALALQADGWVLRMDNIWHKPNPMPSSAKDRTTLAHEYIFHFAPGPTYFYDADALREPHADYRADKADRSAMRGQAAQKPRGREGTPDRYYHPGGRNKRSIWTLAPRGFHGAHFATMPPDLAETCVRAGTSERGCCAACGAPWRRVTQRIAPPPTARGLRLVQAHVRKAARCASGGTAATTLGAGVGGSPAVRYQTVGWEPTCACDAGEPVPCTVLDVCAGSGTTLAVAHTLGRHAIGCELQPAYVALIHQRVAAARRARAARRTTIALRR